jgi:hypothetical protein
MSKMKKLQKYLIAFGIAFLLANWSFSQGTLEEQLLNPKELKLRSYFYQATAGNRDIKLLVLENLLKEFDAQGYTENDKTLVDLLSVLSQEGSKRVIYENGRKINDFPDVRRASVMVLAKVGGADARDILVDALLSEKNDVVKAEICIALESDNIGDNASGDALNALIYTYRKSYKPSENFVFAVINVVKKLAKPNSANFADAISVLSDIQMGSYSRKIRTEALKALNEISGVQ